MNFWYVFLIVVGTFVVLPVLAYMVVKFGAAGYFRAKRREDKKKEN